MKTKCIEDKNQIDEIIHSCKICYLGVIDSEGKPYVVPMNFAYAENYIYMHGADEGNLMDAMKKNPEVCVTFCTPADLVFQDEHVACSYRMKGKSVVARGEIEFITDYNKKVDALNFLMQKYTHKNFNYNSPAVNNVAIYRIKPGCLTGREFGAPHGNNFPWQIERDRRKLEK